MLKEDWIFRRGDIYIVELEPKIGFVQSGIRPVIVLQNNCGNFFAPTLIVAPLSSNIYKKESCQLIIILIMMRYFIHPLFCLNNYNHR